MRDYEHNTKKVKAEPKKKRQQNPRYAPIPVDEIREAKAEAQRIATIYSALVSSIDAVQFAGSIEVDGGRQLQQHLKAIKGMGGQMLSYIYTTYPDAIPLAAVPESVPDSGQNTRNGAAESRTLPESEQPTKHKKSP